MGQIFVIGIGNRHRAIGGAYPASCAFCFIYKAGTLEHLHRKVAGIQGAMDLADAGFYVYLVESSPAIGGVMAGLDKTFPTNDCSI